MLRRLYVNLQRNTNRLKGIVVWFFCDGHTPGYYVTEPVITAKIIAEAVAPADSDNETAAGTYGQS